MCECILCTNIKQLLHATGRQTNKTQIIGVTKTINKRNSYVSPNTTQYHIQSVDVKFEKLW